MKRLAIGPARDFPSWHWIGLDMARALGGSFATALFQGFGCVPPSDAVVAIKVAPPLRFVRRVQAGGGRVIFLPIDGYADEAAIRADRARLGACDLVLAHSESLAGCLAPHCRRVGFVEHHGKYTLPEPAAWRPEGFVLWVGGMQNIPYLLAWIERHPLRHPLRILTDTENPRALRAARRVAAGLGVGLRVAAGSINGHEMRPWSEAAQRAALRECKAALDIKGDGFNQRTKPPAKAQKYVSSGIPFACNPDSEAARYFRDRGFALASPEAEARWYSEEYWRETQRFAATLRRTLALESVAETYRAHIEAVLKD
ncbi:MAG: hypothetical protein AB7V53_04985 [Dongiaceae bacterium]